MKILIGYDGSEGADLGVEGLQRAGLPPQDAEALVVTVGCHSSQALTRQTEIGNGDYPVKVGSDA